MKRLIQIENNSIIRQIPLNKKVYRLGRGKENDIVFDSPKVSRVHAILSEGFIASEKISAFGETLFNVLNPPDKKTISTKGQNKIPNLPVFYSPLEIKYYPEMLDWVAEEIAALLAKSNNEVTPQQAVALRDFIADIGGIQNACAAVEMLSQLRGAA